MVTDRAPWSEALAAWLREAVAAQIPVLGICYGHQLLAHALGGEVEYHPGGIELGTVPVRVTGHAVDDALFGGMPEVFPAQAVHRQSVRRLPPGAVLLAENEFEPHHAYRVGSAAWGVQFHPEFSPLAIASYIEHLAGPGQNSALSAAGLLAQVFPTPQAASILKRFAMVASNRGSVPSGMDRLLP
jgi:GMP synthase (glutamine-hydrolysing)